MEGTSPKVARREALIARLEQLDELQTRRAGKSLHEFIRLMWPQLEPSQPFIDGWHIGCICEHLEGVYRGQIKNLIINQPPGTSKSITASVAFPAWIWTSDPGKRFLCLSNIQRLTTRDSMRMRQLVLSDAYQSRWRVELSDDQNAKTQFNTTAGGFRMSIPLNGSFVGEHPHGKIIDDPHPTNKMVLTDIEIETAIEVFDYALPSRGAPLNAWTVLMMQRLHERDLSGHWLSKSDPSVFHLCLPMRYEPPKWVFMGGTKELRPRMLPSPVGKNDPRTVAGELLCPRIWSQEKVEHEIKYHLGTWGDSGQFQQEPAPAGGLLFKRDHFQFIDEPSETVHAWKNVIAWVRYWDVAATEGGNGPQTVGVRMGLTRDGKYVISDIQKARFAPHDVDSLIYATAQKDLRRVPVREEHEGGSAGKAVISARAKRLAGFDYDGDLVSQRGNKEERAHPLATQVFFKNVYLVQGPETDEAQRLMMREFVDQASVFPAGALKDQIDAASGAFYFLTQDNVGEVELLFSNTKAIPELEDEIVRLERELGLRNEPTVA